MGHYNKELADQRKLVTQRIKAEWLEQNSLPLIVSIQSIWREHVEQMFSEEPPEHQPSLWDFLQTNDDALTLLARYGRELGELDQQARQKAAEECPGELWIEDEKTTTITEEA
jgi:hypothetical protein